MFRGQGHPAARAKRKLLRSISQTNNDYEGARLRKSTNSLTRQSSHKNALATFIRKACSSSHEESSTGQKLLPPKRCNRHRSTAQQIFSADLHSSSLKNHFHEESCTMNPIEAPRRKTQKKGRRQKAVYLHHSAPPRGTAE